MKDPLKNNRCTRRLSTLQKSSLSVILFIILVNFQEMAFVKANHMNMMYKTSKLLSNNLKKIHTIQQSSLSGTTTAFIQYESTRRKQKHHNLTNVLNLKSSPLNILNQNDNASNHKQILPKTFMSSSILLLSKTNKSDDKSDDFFASQDEYPNFESIGIKSPILIQRLEQMLQNQQKLVNNNNKSLRPTAVQAASFSAISSGNDVTIGAETGSGKTLAYLLPIIDDILRRKERNKDDFTGYDYARAIILVPNKELANQVIRMALPLCGGSKSIVWLGGYNDPSPLVNLKNKAEEDDVTDEQGDDPNTIVRLGLLPGGLSSPQDFRPFRLSLTDPINNPPLDIVITTPASLGPLGLDPKNIAMFADIQTLIIDEADMLLDGGYIRPLENVLLGFKRANKLMGGRYQEEEENSNNDIGEDSNSMFEVKRTQHVLVAATIPDMGLKSVDSYIQKKFPYATRVTMKGMHNARHYGLKERNVWVQDDADELQVNKKRLEVLVDMLRVDNDSIQEKDTSFCGLKGEKVMVFLNSSEDVDGVTNALRRAGMKAVPFHAKVPLEERTKHLDSFRRYVAHESKVIDQEDCVPVLVCTDLAARGLDIPGVTAVVQLQFSGNVVSHLHRMGRCGRAGKRDGRGVIFYGELERELVDVVRDAEMLQDKMVLKGDVMELNNDEITSSSTISRTSGGGGNDAGKVKDAFSRRRGFTKKRKKIRRQEFGERDSF